MAISTPHSYTYKLTEFCYYKGEFNYNYWGRMRKETILEGELFFMVIYGYDMSIKIIS